MGTGRLEAFSDGVIAVAITLLVLNIHVEPGPGESLAHALGHLWPVFAAYVTSFLTIGIIWINHRAMLSRLREADHTLLVLNLLLLMTIVLLPFATELIARYLQASSGQRTAAAVYAGALLLMAVTFSLVNHHILIRRADLLAHSLELAQRRTILRRSLTGVIPYAVATALAAFSPYATLAVTAALAVFYALPSASSASLGDRQGPGGSIRDA